jgi:hypothetical protein
LAAPTAPQSPNLNSRFWQDCERQKLNCFRMTEMGATVVPVQSGSRTLKDAVNEALRDWVRGSLSPNAAVAAVPPTQLSPPGCQPARAPVFDVVC